jgi:hypothetical protein
VSPSVRSSWSAAASSPWRGAAASARWRSSLLTDRRSVAGSEAIARPAAEIEVARGAEAVRTHRVRGVDEDREPLGRAEVEPAADPSGEIERAALGPGAGDVQIAVRTLEADSAIRYECRRPTDATSLPFTVNDSDSTSPGSAASPAGLLRAPRASNDSWMPSIATASFTR